MADSDSKSVEPAGQQTHGINRRQLLLGMGAAATFVSGGLPLTTAEAAAKHDHSKHKAQHEKLLNTVNNCLDKGQRCIAHCLVVFQEGDTKLADCAAKVHEMQAVCDAYSYLLTANSSYSKGYASICSQVCEDCEKECREHDHHVESRDCAEACIDVMEEIRRTFG